MELEEKNLTLKPESKAKLDQYLPLLLLYSSPCPTTTFHGNILKEAFKPFLLFRRKVVQPIRN